MTDVIDSDDYRAWLRAYVQERCSVDQATGCWLWTRGLSPHGYGEGCERGGASRAHRMAYRGFVGPIPEGLELDHVCRVRRCVNPEHLEPVTHQENMRRGETIAAANALKTHCRQGHPYDAANTHVLPDGSRTCRTCHRERMKRARSDKPQARFTRRQCANPCPGSGLHAIPAASGIGFACSICGMAALPFRNGNVRVHNDLRLENTEHRCERKS